MTLIVWLFNFIILFVTFYPILVFLSKIHPVLVLFFKKKYVNNLILVLKNS